MNIGEEQYANYTKAQKEIISEALDWGYGNQYIYTRPEIWKDKKILDIGMGGGPHCIPFIIGGAKSYVGVDPLVGTDLVKDMNSNRDSRNESGYRAFPHKPEKIMAEFDNIRLISGFLEDHIDEVANLDVDLVVLSAVTEHLGNPDLVIEAAHRASASGAKIWLSHANYYSWTGHHQQPRSTTTYDRNNKQHNSVVDWKHLEPGHYCYTMSHLNRMRLMDFSNLLRKYYKILDWNIDVHGLERLTKKRRRELSRYSLEELLARMVYVSGERRERPLETDLSACQFYHPEESYLENLDFSDEEWGRFELSNRVFFAKNGPILGSHESYNLNSAKKLFSELSEGDIIRLKRYPLNFSLAVEKIVFPENGSPYLRVEGRPGPVNEENRTDWSITQVIRNGKKIFEIA